MTKLNQFLRLNTGDGAINFMYDDEWPPPKVVTYNNRFYLRGKTSTLPDDSVVAEGFLGRGAEYDLAVIERPDGVPAQYEPRPCINIEQCGNMAWVPFETPNEVDGMRVAVTCSAECVAAILESLKDD